MSVRVREGRPGDAAALSRILNEHIERGGTTALERTLTPDAFAEKFFAVDQGALCLVAFGADAWSGFGIEVPLGFQHVERHPALPPDWLDIATFARIRPKVPGVGRALFSAMRSTLRGHGVTAINATIRADNTGGLAYYEAVGFRTYKVVPSVPLADGTPVDRVSKRHDLADGRHHSSAPSEQSPF